MVFITNNLGKFLSMLVLFFSTHLISAQEQPEDYTRYVNVIVDQFTKEMKHKYGLICIGSGGRMPHKVERITLFLDCYHRSSIEEARELYIKIVDRFTEMINKYEKIRPFLKEYPFPTEGAGIYLSFQRKDGSYYLDGSVASISQGREQKLYYSTAEKQKILHPSILDVDGSIMRQEYESEDIMLVDLLDEPYADAERIVHAAQGLSAQP